MRDTEALGAGYTEIERAVEAQLSSILPEVDLRELRVGGSRRDPLLRVVIDHPDGVDHGLCTEVTAALDGLGLRDQFSVEVSSPGPEPPLRSSEHFREVVGQRVRLRVAGDGEGSRSRECTGTLVGVEGDVLTMALADGPTQIPLASVRRARALANEHARPSGAPGGATP